MYSRWSAQDKRALPASTRNEKKKKMAHDVNFLEMVFTGLQCLLWSHLALQCSLDDLLQIFDLKYNRI